MAKNKTSETITAEADVLQAKLAALRKEARKLKKLEDQQKAEAKRQADIAYALEFVEFAKTVPFGDTGKTYFDVIKERMAGEAENGTGDVASDDIPILPEEDEATSQEELNRNQNFRRF